MNPEFPQNPRQELEARLTALLLGELGTEDAAALREAIRADAELARLYEQLKVTVALVRESAVSAAEQTAPQPPPLKLPSDRREKLLANFKTIAPEEFAKPRESNTSPIITIAATAAVLMLLAAIAIPNFIKARTTSQKNSIINNLRVVDGAKQQWALENNKTASAEPTFNDLKPYMGRDDHEPLPAVAGETYKPGKMDEPPVAVMDASKAKAQGLLDLSRPSPEGHGKVEVFLPGANEQLAMAKAPEPAMSAPRAVNAPKAEIVLPTTVPPASRPTVADVPARPPEPTSAMDDAFALGGDMHSFSRLVAPKTPSTAEPATALRWGGSTEEKYITTNGTFQLSDSGISGGGGAGNRIQATVTFDDSSIATATNAEPFSAGALAGNSPQDRTQFSFQNEVQSSSGATRGKKDVAFQSSPSTGMMGPALPAEAPKAKSESVNNWADSADRDSAFAKKSAPYYEAKRELKQLQDFAQILQLKTASVKIDTSLPQSTLVTIVDKAAAPSETPTTLSRKLRKLFTDKVEASADIRIERDHPDVPYMNDSQSCHSYDPYFIQTEFEIIQSEEVLGKVIDALDLNTEWGKKYNDGKRLTTAETMKILKGDLDLQPVPNTSIIKIGISTENPQEAAKIANQIAETFREYREEQRETLAGGDLKTLKEEIVEQNEKVKAKQDEVHKLQQELGIPDSLAALDQPVPSLTGQALTQINSHQTDAPLPKPAALAPIPQPETLTRDNAFSTFSLNVSDVSFKLAAACLQQGQMPDPASIRSEEFINAFDYRDPAPAPGLPFAFTSERARYPFAHNRDLLRFSLKTAASGRAAGRPLNLVLLLDNSGSMERADRVQIIHEALRVLAGQLQPQDKFSIVTFARTAQLRVDGIPGNEASAATDKVSQLTPQGGTNLGDALDLAYATVLRHYLANGDNHVVLLTDGAANLGNVDPGALEKKVETNRRQGVALDCFGIGWEGYNDDLLEVLTRHGDGRYGFINTPEEAAGGFAAQLAGALNVAASDVKVQVEFNTNRATAYRQIGYAKHQLTKEQFRDNTVDAAAMAAAESGNALYVIETNPQGDGPIATVHVRYRMPGAAEYREHVWDVPYTGGAVSLEQAGPAMRLAATASAFSEWLAASPYAAEVTPDRLLGYLHGVPEVYGADHRPKQLEWMIRQAKSFSGK